MRVRVYIADDIAEVRELLRAQLASDREVEVVGEAADGMSALEEIVAMRPDVALLDVSMPRLDGVTLVRRLREIGVGTRLVVVSAGTPAQEASAREAGCDAFLSKPVPAARLREAVHAAANGHGRAVAAG
jgi:DNA-binding NarL/FixJ family response regulator